MCSSDIVTVLPSSSLILAIEGKQLFPGGGVVGDGGGGAGVVVVGTQDIKEQ